ncbi:RAP protein [Plasmodium cynomolgi strain B]|uniref:RAP protein n=1 Tax=Plasmodium cynomolgi (strain B) TaxID=1120755 RepID=K6ULN6_PLACD|nr:RAP protein [Plasmodium cynomolgi strain B]GAB67878.1 RAP protein [Plasmodium cynomolgi strain B]
MGENFKNDKDIRSYNALKNNESYSASNRTNTGANFAGGRETDPFSDMSDNQEGSNNTSACVERETTQGWSADGRERHPNQVHETTQGGKDEQTQKGKKGEHTDHSDDSAKKGKQCPSNSAQDNPQHKNNPLNIHPGNTNSAKEEHINNDAEHFESTTDEPNEATEFCHMGGKDQTRRPNCEGNSESGRNPEFAQEQQFSNSPNEGSNKWAENDEDIPNIFEVDENLSEEEKKEKLKLIKLITEKLAGPLKTNSQDNLNSGSEGGQNSGEDSIFADNRPIAIEVDGPSHFYANSNRYTTYTKLKHRILTKLGYNVIHISYIDWRKLRNKSEREEFILKKLKEKNDEFLDENDRIYYNERMNMIKEDYKKFMKEKKESSS